MDAEKLEEYLGNELDLENYVVVGIHPQTSDRAVVILHDKRELSAEPWCLVYRGTVRSFLIAEDALEYFKSRNWRFLGTN